MGYDHLHKTTPEYQVAKANFSMAVDQQDSYASIIEALEAFSENAWDEAKDRNLRPILVIDIYEQLIRESVYSGYLDSMWREFR